jgi:hypothetical protein
MIEEDKAKLFNAPVRPLEGWRPLRVGRAGWRKWLRMGPDYPASWVTHVRGQFHVSVGYLDKYQGTFAVPPIEAMRMADKATEDKEPKDGAEG